MSSNVIRRYMSNIRTVISVRELGICLVGVLDRDQMLKKLGLNQ